MTTAIQELLQVADELDQLAARAGQEEIQRPLEQLKQAAEEVSKAWSGSWLGYHANVYYRGLQPPPQGAHFNREMGLRPTAFVPGSRGDWVEYQPDEVVEEIYASAGDPDLRSAHVIRDEASKAIEKHKMTLLSVVDLVLSGSDSSFLSRLREKVDKLTPISETNFVRAFMPIKTMSSDTRAISEGFRVPPHYSVLADVAVIKHTLSVVNDLSELATQTSSHLSRVGTREMPTTSAGNRIFIGHGQSPIWRELKDFIEGRLGLQVDEFNRVPIAGMTTIDRLSEMMDFRLAWHFWS